MESAITAKGQATIPKAIREHLRLKPGDRVKFFMHPDGSVVLDFEVPALWTSVAACNARYRTAPRRAISASVSIRAARSGGTHAAATSAAGAPCPAPAMMAAGTAAMNNIRIA